ncbi:MAG: heme ABC transporter permease CcmC [Alphaproteobacteria bacterium]|nr:heme ABC transporter permease CcmC [Alphaproteobacteria bacterium]
MMTPLTSLLSPLFRLSILITLAKGTWPFAALLCILCFGIGTYTGLFQSPSDYQQGEMVRFLYLHVPASWCALMVYSIMAIFSLIGFMSKIPTAHMLTKALAIPGTMVTGISLTTGSLWGKPVWGTYWVWDARLTSMLILFFIYLGYISLAFHQKTTLKKLERLSILVMVGFVNIPIIKWSVDFWFTLHQPPSIMRMAKPAIDPAFWSPLLWMTGAYLCFLVSMTALLFLGIAKQYRLMHRPLSYTTSSTPLKDAA